MERRQCFMFLILLIVASTVQAQVTDQPDWEWTTSGPDGDYNNYYDDDNNSTDNPNYYNNYYGGSCSDDPTGTLDIDDIPSHMYPFGLEEGDTTGPHSDDSSSPQIFLSQAFNLFGQKYNSLWVNSNGHMTFVRGFGSYIAESFPISDQSYSYYWGSSGTIDNPIIAAYWTDVDPGQNDGIIYYRQTTDAVLLDRSGRDIRRAFSGSQGYAGFQADWMFVATWHDVTYYGGSPCTNVNSFQIVLVTGNDLSFVMLNYGPMTWTKNGNDATVGYDADDSSNYYMVPSSRTPDIADIDLTSNVGESGRWVFRIDGTDPVNTIDCTEHECPPNQRYNDTLSVCEGTELPALAECSPTLVGPVVEDDLYVTFYCDVELLVTDPDARILVTFLFDNVPGSAPDVILVPPETRATLHERYLYEHLGKWIGCKAVTYWLTDASQFSMEAFSQTYWAGIKPSASMISVREDDETPVQVSFYSTIPITCTYRDADHLLQGCDLDLRVWTSSDNIAVATHSDEPGTVPKCTYRMSRTDWDPVTQRTHTDQVVDVTARRDPVQYSYDIGELIYTVHPDAFSDVNLITKVDQNGDPYTNMWFSGQLGSVDIFRSDSRGASCYSTGDPYIYTFDNTYYSAQQTGIFVLAKSTSSRKFDVHIRHWACTEGVPGCSIACAVAIREGNVAYGLDMCNQYKRVHRLQLSQSALEESPIRADASRTHWVIRMPSGAYVSVYIRTWGRGGMNVYLNVPASDRGKTSGLCGTYDGDRYNELLLSNGSLVDANYNSGWGWWWDYDYDSLNDFIESWRLRLEDSLFQKPPEYDASLEQENIDEFCSCLIPSSIGITCGNTIIDNSLDATGFVGDIMDVFMPIWIASSNTVKRRKRSVDSNHNNELQHHVRSRRSTSDTDVTDNVDENYEILNVEEDSSNPENVTWPTSTGITKAEATLYCDTYLRESTLYQTCGDYIAEDDFVSVRAKCVSDIGRTSDCIWAEDKVADLLTLCVEEVLANTTVAKNVTTDVVLQEVQAITSVICPNDCSAQGSCTSGNCQCDSGFVGADCSVVEGTPPSPLGYLSPVLCDIKVRLCQSVRIVADNLVNSEDLTCRIHGKQLDGTEFNEDVQGVMVSYNEATCPLNALYTIDLGQGPMPLYWYTISLSNDGNTFSSPLVPVNSVKGAVVYDSACIQCSQSGDCVVMSNTCKIQDRCYGEQSLNPNNICEACNPDIDSTDWTPLSDNQAPVLTYTAVSKVQGKHLQTSLPVYDKEAHAISFTLLSTIDTSLLTLSSSGILTWFSTDKALSRQITVGMEDECGAVTEVIISLITTCPPKDPGCQDGINHCQTAECQHGRCIEELDGYSCDCPLGYQGDLCDLDIDECISGPCVHGECVDGVNRFSCECDSGYTGTLCDRVATVCDPSPCQNRATCTIQTDTSYTCNCREHYRGRHCKQYTAEGDYGEWTAYSACSKPCDYGLQSRTRECLRGQCQGQSEEQQLCNEYNCPEDKSEQNEGVTLTMSGTTLQQIALDADGFINITTQLVNSHCSDEVESCCQALQHSYNLNKKRNKAFVNTKHVTVAQGFPKNNSQTGKIEMKMLVQMTSNDVMARCGSPQARRRKREATSEYFDQDLLVKIVSAGTGQYEQALGVNVEVSEMKGDDTAMFMIIGAVLGAIVLLVLIIVLIILGTKGKLGGQYKRPASGYKRNLLASPRVVSPFPSGPKIHYNSNAVEAPPDVSGYVPSAEDPIEGSRPANNPVRPVEGSRPVNNPVPPLTTTMMSPASSVCSSAIGLGSLNLMEDDELMTGNGNSRVGSARSCRSGSVTSRMPVLEM